ncbi:hypothetical protein PFISCL1PPCAC_12278, partial [Pristionchus fissidentatus]
LFRTVISGFAFLRLNFLPLFYEMNTDSQRFTRIIDFIHKLAAEEDWLKLALKNYFVEKEASNEKTKGRKYYPKGHSWWEPSFTSNKFVNFDIKNEYDLAD